MNKFLIYIFALTCATLSYHDAAALDSQTEKLFTKITHILHETRKREGLDQGTKEILFHFGKVINNFFNLLQDTQNPQHVGECIQGMLTEMVNVGVSAVQNKAIHIEDGMITMPNFNMTELIIALEEAVVQIQQQPNVLSDFASISSYLNFID